MRFKEFIQEATIRSKSHAEVAKLLKQWFFKKVFTKSRKDDDVDYHFMSLPEWQEYKWERIVNFNKSENRIRIGGDWLRYYLTSENIPGLDKRPDEEEWRERVEAFFNKLLKPLGWFVFAFKGYSILIDPLTQKIIENLKTIYHFSPAWNKDSILKKGLIPQGSQGKYADDFKYPPRIHLLTKYDEDEMRQLAFHIYNFDASPEEVHRGATDHVPLAIFEVDVNKCHRNIKFYEDVSVKNGVWTYTHIPATALKLKHVDSLT